MSVLNFDNLPIFRTGDYKGVRFDRDALDGIATAFSTSREEIKIPVKFGELEMGRVCKLWRRGDDLLANFVRLPPEANAALKRGEYQNITVNVLRQAEYDGAAFPWALHEVIVNGAKLPDLENATEPLKAMMFRQLRPKGERLVFRQAWAPELALPSEDDKDIAQMRSIFERAFRGAWLKVYGNERDADEATSRSMRVFDAQAAKKKQ
jgi:hypothetical protein